MTPRFAVRRAVADDGLQLFWLVNAKTGKRILSSVFEDTLIHYATVLNERHSDKAGHRAEAGCW